MSWFYQPLVPASAQLLAGAAVEGTLAVVAAATFDATGAHGVAGTLDAVGVATASLSGEHGVAGTIAAVAVAEAAITGDHGVAGTLAAVAVAEASLAGAHGVSGSLAALAVAEFAGTGEHAELVTGTLAVEAAATFAATGDLGEVIEPPVEVVRGGSVTRRRIFAVPARVRPVPVIGEVEIVAAAGVAMVGEARQPNDATLLVRFVAAMSATGTARPPIPLRALAPAARTGALRVAAAATVSVVGEFDAERMDEEDLLLRAWPMLSRAA